MYIGFQTKVKRIMVRNQGGKNDRQLATLSTVKKKELAAQLTFFFLYLPLRYQACLVLNASSKAEFANTAEQV